MEERNRRDRERAGRSGAKVVRCVRSAARVWWMLGGERRIGIVMRKEGRS